MLSSAKHQRDHRLLSATTTNKNNNKRSLTTTTTSISSSSSSLSTSSSSSSSPLDSQANKRSLITMEEVWKDINLSSFHHLNRHSQHHPQHNLEQQPRSRSHSNQQSQNPNSIFQDFLNGPLNQEPTSLTMAASASNGDSTTVTALFTPPLPPPATVLSLNSGAGFEFLDNQDPLITPNSNMHSHRHLSAHVTSFNTPFESLVTSDCFGKKRSQENEGSGNRRHKRMIKNRESAARSRARKQAYTNELELEVAHLQAENARLRRQQEQDQLKMAAANQQPKKNTLQRSNTAPF